MKISFWINSPEEVSGQVKQILMQSTSNHCTQPQKAFWRKGLAAWIACGLEKKWEVQIQIQVHAGVKTALSS
jgi:hypothetical protein